MITNSYTKYKSERVENSSDESVDEFGEIVRYMAETGLLLDVRRIHDFRIFIIYKSDCLNL